MLSKNPKVTIVLPVYNVENYLDKCIKSIVEQSYQNIEIIVIDDGSLDNSFEVCKKWEKQDGRIRLFHKENEGLGKTRNLGIDKMTGEYVIFLDSDDWIEHDYIENLVNEACEQDSDIVIPGHKLVRDNGEFICNCKMIANGIYATKAEIEDILLKTIAAPIDNPNDETIPQGADKLYKKSLFENDEIRFSSEKDALGEDVLFNARIIGRCSTISIINEYGYNYRMNLSSISNTYERERGIRGENFYKYLIKILKEYNLIEKGKYHVARAYLGKSRVAIRLISDSKASFKWKIGEIDYLLNSSTMKEATRIFPIKKYNYYLQIVSFCMRYKLSVLVYLLFVIRRLRKNIL